MRPYKFILLLFIFSINKTYAHQDFWMTKTFGKVKVRITTGFEYEEINKAWIIGELTNKLANNLKYNDTIFLDFNHHYTGDCLPDYFVSFDDGSIKQTWSGGKTLYFLKNKAIVIREVSRKFDASKTLRLAEYAIQNLTSIKRTQNPLTYNKNYCQWLINSIDTSLIRQTSLSKPSKVILEVMANKIYRPQAEKSDNNDISYFFQNNKYHIFYSDYKVKDSVLLTVENVYQLKNTSYNEAIVLETDSSFYYVRGGSYKPYASKSWTIEYKHNFYQPYDIAKVGSSKITFSFRYYSKEEGRQPKERTLLYQIDSDKLTQDLDKQLNK